ncbi:hypothetical protein [Aeoliella sp.]|uniref:hypothetical protein n=1 Tax=Aeoliella sp. TaxID=2795800 RepID=UPI003CCC27EF
MSYDLCLYRPEFLRHAIENNLGDWTDADPISEEMSDSIVAHLLRQQYSEQQYPWLIGRCFSHPDSGLQIEAHLYTGSLVFSVSYGPRSSEAVQVATNEARSAAKLFGLGFVDPETGAIVT